MILLFSFAFVVYPAYMCYSIEGYRLLFDSIFFSFTIFHVNKTRDGFRSFSLLSKINIISAIIFILSVVFILTLRDMGTGAVFRWIICLFCISLFLRPLLNLRALKLFDGGFSISMGLGTGMSFLLVWFFSAAGLISFNTPACVAGLLILTAIVNTLSIKGRTVFKWDKRELTRFMLGFALFMVLFSAAFYVKGFKASLDSQTEQFMDYGFMQTMYRQKELAPYDMWFSGSRLNYYYLGQAMAVYLCRLSLVTPEYGYNLMLCTIFAAVFMMAASLTGSVASFFSREVSPVRYLYRAAGALIGALLTICGGNGHYLIYGKLLPFVERITKKELVKDFWFPDSTAFIGNFPEVDDKGKHEFPSYTMVLGDLHAHVCNMLFTIPLLTLLLDYAAASMTGADAGPCRTPDKTEEKKTANLQEHGKKSEFMHVLKEVKKDSYKAELERERNKEAGASKPVEKRVVPAVKALSFADFDKRELYSGFIFLTALLLGLFSGVNYWDFPIYFIIAGAVILFCDYRKYGISVRTTLFVLLKGLIILIIESIVMLPFSLNFEKISSEIGLCDRHTALWQLVLIWGFRIYGAGALLVYIILHIRREKKANSMELALIALISCAVGLIIMPEIIYVRDIYGDAYQRYNTMFKLTYQGYILFGIIIGIAIPLLLSSGRAARINAVLFIILGLFSATYITTSCKMWFGNVFNDDLRQGISAVDFMRRGDNDYSLEWGAIEYLNSLEDRHINIVEAGGTSYQPDCKLSVFTGANTVIGWYVHEWLWRNDSDIVGRRTSEVRMFYEGGDLEYCKDFIDRYGVEYIYIGPREYNYYNINFYGFWELCTEVWANDNYRLLRVDYR